MYSVNIYPANSAVCLLTKRILLQNFVIVSCFRHAKEFLPDVCLQSAFRLS
jgi:hypothetical protein